MEESTLRWPTDWEREEMEEACSIGENAAYRKERLVIFETRLSFVGEGEYVTSDDDRVDREG